MKRERANKWKGNGQNNFWSRQERRCKGHPVYPPVHAAYLVVQCQERHRWVDGFTTLGTQPYHLKHKHTSFSSDPSVRNSTCFNLQVNTTNKMLHTETDSDHAVLLLSLALNVTGCKYQVEGSRESELTLIPAVTNSERWCFYSYLYAFIQAAFNWSWGHPTLMVVLSSLDHPANVNQRFSIIWSEASMHMGWGGESTCWQCY